MKFYDKFVNWFVRRLIGDSVDLYQIHAAQLYVQLSFVVIFVGSFFLPLIYLNHSHHVAIAIAIAIFLGFFSLNFFSFRMGKIVGMINFFTVVFLVNFFWGGWQSPAFIWFGVVPLFAICQVGTRYGIVWFFLSLISVLFFYLADIYKITFINELDPKLYLLTHAVFFVGALVSLSSLVYIYERFKDRLIGNYESSQVELKESKELFSAILNNSPAVIYIKDLDSRYLMVNSQFERNFNVISSEIVGKSSFDVHPYFVAEKVRLNDLEVQKRAGADIYEEVILHGDEPHTYISVKFPLKNSAGQLYAVCGISTDITDLKNVQLEKEQMQAQLFQSSRLASLGEMAGGVAHEINNPLAVIAGTSRRIRRVLQRGTEERDKIESYLDDIDLVIDRMGKIVEGLRAFSRDGSNDGFTKIKVSSIIDGAVALCQEKFKHKNIELSVDISKHESDLTIYCNEVQIGQVIINLLNNAHDAILELSERWILISVRDVNEKIEIVVTDSGKGIAPEIANKLMYPFFTTKPVGYGTGLGLSISRGIVENHGGMLILDTNAPNTSFVVTLPKG